MIARDEDFDFTIEEFWKERIKVESVSSTGNLISGWHGDQKNLKIFQEAPLRHNKDLTQEYDPFECPILLISAPGAVGKSTLARQIAFHTGAVYVDLSAADAVGANTISGGLVKSGLYQSWQSQKTTLLIDGLDEARLRVTQEAFEAFLDDIAKISQGRKLPIVLFGRSNAVEHAWMFLEDQDVETALMEIEYYDQESATELACSIIEEKVPNSPHKAVHRQAVSLLIDLLYEETNRSYETTKRDGNRFVGYAPVILVVAESVAKETNPRNLIEKINEGNQPVTLQRIIGSILDREHKKLEKLAFEDNRLKEKLYRAEEQLDYLVSHLYKSPPPQIPSMNANDTTTYSSAIETWVFEHPFLDGNGYDSSSVVFDAAICAHALIKGESISVTNVVQKHLKQGRLANPFLSEFYLENRDKSQNLPPEFVGVIYASLRSKLSLGETANLMIDTISDLNEENIQLAEIDITMQQEVMRFNMEKSGPIMLGQYVEDINLIVPEFDVEIGPGREGVFAAPVNIQCATLIISTDKVVIESSRNDKIRAVNFEANYIEATNMPPVPVIRGNAKLSVFAPNSSQYPWHGFSYTPKQIENHDLDEAFRRFRQFVIAFRSHNKGALARYRHKLEHERMTKGAGEKVLRLMRKNSVIVLRDDFYFLSPSVLGKETGMSYLDFMSYKVNDKVIEFLKRAIS